MGGDRYLNRYLAAIIVQVADDLILQLVYLVPGDVVLHSLADSDMLGAGLWVGRLRVINI